MHKGSERGITEKRRNAEGKRERGIREIYA